MHELAQLVAITLEYRCHENIALERLQQSVYHSTRVPRISLWDYTRRFAKYSFCSPECFVIALVLIDRYCTVSNIPITYRNVHRLLLTALVLSVKVRDDDYYKNSYYANIGGVHLRELVNLELHLLRVIEWDTWIEPSLFREYVTVMTGRYVSLLKTAAAPVTPPVTG